MTISAVIISTVIVIIVGLKYTHDTVTMHSFVSSWALEMDLALWSRCARIFRNLFRAGGAYMLKQPKNMWLVMACSSSSNWPCSIDTAF